MRRADCLVRRRPLGLRADAAPDGDRAHQRAPRRHLDVARSRQAREPRGVVEGDLLSSGAKVGDVVKVEADVDLEGISILHVLGDRNQRTEPERLELLGSPEAVRARGDDARDEVAHRSSAAS